MNCKDIAEDSHLNAREFFAGIASNEFVRDFSVVIREGDAIALTAPNGEDPRSPLVSPDYDHGRDPRT